MLHPVYQDVFKNLPYPITVIQTNNRLYRDIIYCHWHHGIEFIYVTQGSLELRINTARIVVNAGEAAAVNSNEVHFGNSADGNFCNAFAVVFDTEPLQFSADLLCQRSFIEPITDGALLLPMQITSRTDWGRRVLTSLQSIIDAARECRTGHELAVKAQIYVILSELYGANVLIPVSEKHPFNPQMERLKRCIAYINNRYTERIYISELAKEVNMSEDNFYKYMKKYTGCTPIEFINIHRVDMAQQMLSRSSASISEICFAVGFENLSYFTRTFKRYQGCTPSEYRRQFAYSEKAESHSSVGSEVKEELS